MIPSIIALQIILSLLSICSNPSEAFSSPSPWASGQWRLTLDIGREKSTEMPETWGASGARLVLPLDVTIESESWNGPRDDWGVGESGGSLSVIRPLEEARYVSSRGEQKVCVREGGWKISSPAKAGNRNSGGGHASTLQFWLDVETEAVRNDVSLSGGQRVYFGAKCWRAPDLELGRRAIDPLLGDYEMAQRTLDDRLSHETGDRRLDGTDPLDTVVAYKDMTQLVIQRDEMLRRLKEASRTLPRNADRLPKGNWPGSTELLSVAPTEMLIKQKKMFFGEEFLVIGKWKAVPLKVTENTALQG